MTSDYCFCDGQYSGILHEPSWRHEEMLWTGKDHASSWFFRRTHAADAGRPAGGRPCTVIVAESIHHSRKDLYKR